MVSRGLLCIGDSAHAMSPVGGVGINLAIQDAVATANILGETLRERRVALTDLRAVQHRCERPAHLTQRAQIFMHEHFLERIFSATEQMSPPLPARLLEEFPLLRRITARMVGIGFRPEHVLAGAGELKTLSPQNWQATGKPKMFCLRYIVISCLLSKCIA